MTFVRLRLQTPVMFHHRTILLNSSQTHWTEPKRKSLIESANDQMHFNGRAQPDQSILDGHSMLIRFASVSIRLCLTEALIGLSLTTTSADRDKLRDTFFHYRANYSKVHKRHSCIRANAYVHDSDASSMRQQFEKHW